MDTNLKQPFRKTTKGIRVGPYIIGNHHPIWIQSMCNTKTEDVVATVAQIHALEAAGCDLVRVAVPTLTAAKAIRDIKSQIHIPLVADIHFDYRLALEAVAAGADKIRINPGNIGGDDRLKAVVEACKGKQVPIRVGVNGGSLEKALLERYGGVTPEALVESALNQVRRIEALDYDQIIISIKASDVRKSIVSYRLLSEQTDYPLHIGITEAGTDFTGTIKSSVGIGGLLLMGLGDTLRVSLSADPVKEVQVAIQILKALGLRKGIEIIACPTCGRTNVDLIGLANQVETKIGHLKVPLKIAVMGCAVNGPGEAREADFGIAGGLNEGILFKKGKVIKKVPEDHLLEALMAEINQWLLENNESG